MVNDVASKLYRVCKHFAIRGHAMARIHDIHRPSVCNARLGSRIVTALFSYLASKLINDAKKLIKKAS